MRNEDGERRRRTTSLLRHRRRRRPKQAPSPAPEPSFARTRLPIESPKPNPPPPPEPAGTDGAAPQPERRREADRSADAGRHRRPRQPGGRQLRAGEAGGDLDAVHAGKPPTPGAEVECPGPPARQRDLRRGGATGQTGSGERATLQRHRHLRRPDPDRPRLHGLQAGGLGAGPRPSRPGAGAPRRRCRRSRRLRRRSTVAIGHRQPPAPAPSRAPCRSPLPPARCPAPRPAGLCPRPGAAATAESRRAPSSGSGAQSAEGVPFTYSDFAGVVDGRLPRHGPAADLRRRHPRGRCTTSSSPCRPTIDTRS